MRKNKLQVKKLSDSDKWELSALDHYLYLLAKRKSVYKKITPALNQRLMADVYFEVYGDS